MNSLIVMIVVLEIYFKMILRKVVNKIVLMDYLEILQAKLVSNNVLIHILEIKLLFYVKKIVHQINMEI